MKRVGSVEVEFDGAQRQDINLMMKQGQVREIECLGGVKMASLNLKPLDGREADWGRISYAGSQSMLYADLSRVIVTQTPPFCNPHLTDLHHLTVFSFYHPIIFYILL